MTLSAVDPAYRAFFPDGSRLDVIADDSFVDVLAAGCDAGIRYEERLEQDMIAVPIGPRVQRMATAASPGPGASRPSACSLHSVAPTAAGSALSSRE